MISSLFSGVSGLSNHQVRMDVLGNNIANINTIGFKSSRATFQEALVQNMRGAGRPSEITGGTNAVQLGLGMNVASIDNLFTQGGLETTGKITDLAIQGNGFFVLADGTGGEFYSRAGNFGFDANSYLVNPANGLYVQGKMANADGEIPATAAVGNIQLPFGQQDPARQTTQIDLANNLNSVATESEASLVAAGATNIDTVTGIARDGAGGTHEITVAGVQATFSANTTAMGLALTGAETLSSLGVTQAGLDDGTTISLDNGALTFNLAGLTLSSTVTEVIATMNAIDGITVELTGGEIQLTRDYAGDGGIRNASLTMGGAAPAGETLIENLFSAGGTFAANSGANHTFSATDTFTPEGGTAQSPVPLEIEVNDANGLAMGVVGIGGGGITAQSTDELAAGVFSVDTEQTQHATSITVFDSQGGKHTAVCTFTKTHMPNRWDWEMSTTGEEIIRYGSTGTVTFNPDGSLLSFDLDSGAQAFSFDPNNGAETIVVDIDAGTTGAFDGLTGFASNFTATAVNQNGYGMGILDEITIDQTGLIYGIFTNGVSRGLAQITLAQFNNEAGLMKQGRSLYINSANSGEAVQGVAGETISATISSGALESSNVDLASEFTGMITAQRGYQANARVITTSDSMLDELVNLKR
jgi:flagellar hook protein FlgE